MRRRGSCSDQGTPPKPRRLLALTLLLLVLTLRVGRASALSICEESSSNDSDEAIAIASKKSAAAPALWRPHLKHRCRWHLAHPQPPAIFSGTRQRYTRQLTSMSHPNLEALRAQIDAIDVELTTLLCRRLAVAAEIGRAKRAGAGGGGGSGPQPSPIYDPTREAAVLAHVDEVLQEAQRKAAHAGLPGLPLPPRCLDPVLVAAMAVSKELQAVIGRETSSDMPSAAGICHVLGPAGSMSALAAAAVLQARGAAGGDDTWAFSFEPSICDAVAAAAAGNPLLQLPHLAIVPYWTSAGGGVGETVTALAAAPRSTLRILACARFPLRFVVAVKRPDESTIDTNTLLARVARVHTKGEAWAACKARVTAAVNDAAVAEGLPARTLELIPHPSTSAAAAAVGTSLHSFDSGGSSSSSGGIDAAVCSAEAAAAARLRVVLPDAASDPHAATWFAILAGQQESSDSVGTFVAANGGAPSGGSSGQGGGPTLTALTAVLKCSAAATVEVVRAAVAAVCPSQLPPCSTAAAADALAAASSASSRWVQVGVGPGPRPGTAAVLLVGPSAPSLLACLGELLKNEAWSLQEVSALGGQVPWLCC